jgi:hypothetical protein
LPEICYFCKAKIATKAKRITHQAFNI